MKKSSRNSIDDNTEILLKKLDRETLIEIILKQAQRIKDLEKRLEEAERSSYRQAAPFRISEEKKKKRCKSPGQKNGHKANWRKEPDQIDEEITVNLDCCPNCGGEILEKEKIEQIIEEIPEIKPKVTRLITYCGLCKRCGEVHSHHPLKMSEAIGAAKVQIGPQAKMTAIKLQYRYGLSKRKVAEVMKDCFGLSLSAGGLVYMSHWMSKRCDEEYEIIKQQARNSSHIHSDETSWYVGNPKSWLWVFTNSQLTLYKVAQHRNRQIIQEILGEKYKGVLVSDCLGIYDDVNPLQQKCYAHHLKAIGQSLERQSENEKDFLMQLKMMLKQAIKLKTKKSEMSLEKFKQQRANLEKRASVLLGNSRADPEEERIANRLRKQKDHLFTFLDYDDVDATNNRAEQQLRPAVIARKLSCGNRTLKGAHTWEVLSSIMATHHDRKINSNDFFRQKATFSAR